MAGVGELSVSVTARTSKARKNIQDFRKSVGQLPGTIAGAAKGMGRLAASAAGLVGIGAIGFELNRSFQNIDNLAKTADKLGIATDKLAALRFAAEETGAGVSKLDAGLERMVRRTSQAAMGTGASARALKELGLSASLLNNLSPDEQFKQIAESLARVTSQADKARIAFDIFGRDGVALLNTLKLGSEGLTQYEAAAKSLGIAVDRMDAAKIEQANDAMGRLRLAASGLSNEFAIHLAPAATAVSKAVTDVVQHTGKWGVGIVTASAGLAGLAVIVPKVIAGIKAIVSAIKAWRNAQITLMALSGPRGWAMIATGVAVAGAAIYGLNRSLDATATKVTTVAQQSQTMADQLAKANANIPSPDKAIGRQATTSDEAQAELKRLRERNRLLEIGEKAFKREQLIKAGATKTELYNLKILEQRNEELKRAQEAREKNARLVEMQREQRARSEQLDALQEKRKEVAARARQSITVTQAAPTASRGSREEYQLLRQIQGAEARRMAAQHEREMGVLRSIDGNIAQMTSAAKDNATAIAELKDEIRELQFGEGV